MTSSLVIFGIGLLTLGLLLGRLSANAQHARRRTAQPAMRVANALPQTPDAANELIAASRPSPKRTQQDAPQRAHVAVAGFAAWLEGSRRLVAAEERVAQELANLPASRWLVDRYVNSTPRRVPLVLAGPTGIFALWPTDGAWTMNDITMVHHIGAEIRSRHPGYAGSVRSAIVLAFDSMAPRVWFRGEDATSAWIVGIDWLIRWLDSFDADEGLNPDHVRLLQDLAGPQWNRSTIARMPAAPHRG